MTGWAVLVLAFFCFLTLGFFATTLLKFLQVILRVIMIAVPSHAP